MTHTADRIAGGRDDEPIRIFIGSGAASLLERKTLIHSIRKHTRRRLEIWCYDGTRRVVENESGERRDCPVPPDLPRHSFATEFSLFRFLIPDLCDRRGRAIYLDSDMIVLADIGGLFDTPLGEADFAARPDAYPEIAPERWALSAMLIDCGRCRFDLPTIFGLIGAGRFSYAEFAQLGRRARRFLPYVIQPLPAAWNAFDRRDATTRLIHYTDLDRQPWKYRYHPHGDAWFDSFHEARQSGLITEAEIDESIARKFVRPDIRQGNRGADTPICRALAVWHAGALAARDVKRRWGRLIKGTNV